MVHSLFPGQSELYRQIEQDIRHTYTLITSSRYITNRHLEQISIDAKKRLAKWNSNQPWFYYLTYLHGVFSLSTQSYEEYERRFSYFFHAMIEELVSFWDEMKERDDEQPFINHVALLLIHDASVPEAPWPDLLFQMTSHLEKELIETVYTTFSKAINPGNCSRQAALLYSYISLLAEKEMSSLSILIKNGKPYEEQEVGPHFQVLKDRDRWHTMKQWVHTLFSMRQNSYGSLQPYIDEMNAALSSQTETLAAIWDRWLLSPNYQRFLALIQHVPSAEQEKLLDRLLPRLEQKLDQLETAKTYEKLLLKYEKFELATHYLLTYELDPLRLRPEREELLTILQEYSPHLARPIFHQFIVRLVEKKSRLHYEKAAMYLKALQTLYKQAEEDALFFDYVTKLKKMYRTYRAFIEELKQIDI
ncbi:hypothetical protein GN156_02835 [bacterium LRH843]|nr:hypothetical protein [bacterium LRH843]